MIGIGIVLTRRLTRGGEGPSSLRLDPGLFSLAGSPLYWDPPLVREFDPGQFFISGESLKASKSVALLAGNFTAEGSDISTSSEFDQYLDLGTFIFSGGRLHYDPPLVRELDPGSFIASGSSVEAKFTAEFSSIELSRARLYVVMKTPLSGLLGAGSFSLQGGELEVIPPTPFGKAYVSRARAYVVMSGGE